MRTGAGEWTSYDASPRVHRDVSTQPFLGTGYKAAPAHSSRASHLVAAAAVFMLVVSGGALGVFLGRQGAEVRPPAPRGAMPLVPQVQRGRRAAYPPCSSSMSILAPTCFRHASCSYSPSIAGVFVCGYAPVGAIRLGFRDSGCSSVPVSLIT
jgi:hypothetical protein